MTPTVKGPRLTDLSVQASTYGVAIPLLYGNSIRISGNVIWSTGLVESVHKKKGGKGGPSVTTYTYRTSCAVALGEGVLEGVRRIWANGKVIYDNKGALTSNLKATSKVYASGKFYPGNGTQTPDPTIQSHLGAGNTPAYRHTSYIVLKDLQLADYGNVIPNLEFEVVAQTNITVGEVMTDICSRAGTTIEDTDALYDVLEGYAIAQAQNVISAVQPLGVAYAFDLCEQGGSLIVKKRGLFMDGLLVDGDRGAVEIGSGDSRDSNQSLYTVETVPTVQLPRSATINYLDLASNYQQASQVAFRDNGADENNIQFDMPIVLNADKARQIADQVLWGAWAGRRTATEQMSDRYIRVLPGQVIGIPTGDYISPFRITRAQRGDNGVIGWQLQYEDPEVYRSSAIGQEFIPGEVVTAEPGDALFIPIDSAIFLDADDNSGFYWVIGGTSNGFRGAVIERSSDDGVSFSEIDQVGVAATTGTCSVLQDGPTEYWDRGSTLTIAMLHDSDTLESISEDLVLNGGNAAWVGPINGHGGEIIQFATATLIAPGVYEISDLLRGRKGTEYATATHGTDEYFVLLEPESIHRTDFGAGDWNRDRLYKAVAVLTSDVDAAEQDFTNTGEGKRPYSPVHIDGVRDFSNNLTMSWIRRSRVSQPGLGHGPVPIGEETESYEIDVLVSGTPVRTLTSTAPSVVYSAANQTADGITPGNPVQVAIYQMSAVRGRGHPGTATL